MGKTPDFKIVLTTLKIARKSRDRMNAAGVRDEQFPCPVCNKGNIRSALVGPKKHLHMGCSTQGCIGLIQ